MAGDGFDVLLADLPGAGYVWTPAEVPAGLTLIETQGEARMTTDVVGSAQPKVMRFRAERAGDYEIVFTFARPWENVRAETRTIQVHVREREAEESR
jgi:predicted secreted protein